MFETVMLEPPGGPRPRKTAHEENSERLDLLTRGIGFDN